MFEKEAKKHREEFITAYISGGGGMKAADMIGMQKEQSYKDGAEFGYNKAFVEADKNLKAIVTDFNKANKWHYVKDELPRKSDATLCELIPVFVAVKAGYNVSTYGTYWNLRLGKFECLDEVYAWCYAPEPPELPKEIKENEN